MYPTNPTPQNLQPPVFGAPTTTGAPAPRGTTQANANPAAPAWGPANLQQFHQASVSAPVQFPGSSHARAEQSKNLEKQEILKEIDALEKQIAALKEKLAPDEDADTSKAPGESNQLLRTLTNRRHELNKALNKQLHAKPVNPGVASDSDDEDIASPTKTPEAKLKEVNAKLREIAREERAATNKGEEKKSDKLKQQIQELKKEQQSLQAEIDAKQESSNEVTITDADSDVEPDPEFSSSSTGASSTSVDMLAMPKKMIEERKKQLRDLQENLRQLGDSSSDDEERKDCKQGITDLEAEIAQLNSVYSMLQQMAAQAAGETGEKATNISPLLRTWTTRRRPQDQHLSSVSSTSSAQPSPFADRAQKRLSSFAPHNPSPDMHRFLSQGLQLELEMLTLEADELGGQADAALRDVNRLREAIKRDRQNDDVPPKTLQAKEKKLKAREADWLNCCAKIDALMTRVEALEAKLNPQPEKSLKQLEDEYKALIEEHKSDGTRKLEKIYSDKLEKLKTRVEKNGWYRTSYNLMAGWLGFSVSFLLGNTATRWIPGVHSIWVPPLISGTLHMILATPVVKQVAASNWTPASLMELNNNFKLTGAGWSDWWRNETDVARYRPKDPTQTGKLTIDERKAQESKSAYELFKKRYADEEAGYWSYTMNYTCKAAGCAAMAKYFATNTTESKIVETVLHALTGKMSGAEYVVFQQYSRSTQPGARQVVTPTREIFADEAAYLKSLREDLEAAVAQWKNQDNHDPKDQTERRLHKAISRVRREEAIALKKSEVAGILKYEWGAQFTGEAKWDTLSEVLSRIITLAPVQVVGYLTAPLRQSTDPLEMFLGHFLPAVALMMPLPTAHIGITGWTGRFVVSGMIRAAIQMFINGSGRQTVATQVPRQQAEGDSSEVSSASSDEDSTSESSEDGEVGVRVPQGQPEDEEEDLRWTGVPTERDENAAN